MKIIVLASGSKGNSTYIEYKDTKILVDFGMNETYIKSELEKNGIDIKDIDAVLITHTHSDHINGLKTFVKKSSAKIYILEEMNKDLKLSHFNELEDINKIKDLEIEIIHNSHDKPSIGYIIKGNIEVVYITDTGYINEKNHKKIENKEVYILESNHDIEMLMNGPYPYYLKQRILSDKGHLSNISATTYLNKLIKEKTKLIVLAHLSETNNSEEKAIHTFKENINAKIEMKIAKQNESLEPIIF